MILLLLLLAGIALGVLLTSIALTLGPDFVHWLGQRSRDKRRRRTSKLGLPSCRLVRL